MRIHARHAAAIVLLCSSLGCTAPRPGEPPEKQTVSDEEQVRALLARFEEGVQKDDVSLIMSLYSPRLPPDELQRERNRVEGAVRSFRYSDYRLLHQAKLPAESLRRGQLKLVLQFSRPGGKTADDVFSFRREGGQWVLVGVGLETPDKGEDVDLRGEERDQIVGAVSRCNQAILSGDMDALIGALASDLSPKKRAEVKEDLVNLLNLHKYQYFSSSFSRSALDVEFAPHGLIAVPLDFMFVRHDGTRGERKLRFCFRRFESGWELVDIDQRDSTFWKNVGKIALPLMIRGAGQAAQMAF